jgi:hypothetical protein
MPVEAMLRLLNVVNFAATHRFFFVLGAFDFRAFELSREDSLST